MSQIIELGEFVRPADAAAFPGAVGEVVEASTVLHSVTREPVARYLRVNWGAAAGPSEWQAESTGVVRADAGLSVQPSLFVIPTESEADR